MRDTLDDDEDDVAAAAAAVPDRDEDDDDEEEDKAIVGAAADAAVLLAEKAGKGVVEDAPPAALRSRDNTPYVDFVTACVTDCVTDKCPCPVEDPLALRGPLGASVASPARPLRLVTEERMELRECDRVTERVREPVLPGPPCSRGVPQ